MILAMVSNVGPCRQKEDHRGLAFSKGPDGIGTPYCSLRHKREDYPFIQSLYPTINWYSVELLAMKSVE